MEYHFGLKVSEGKYGLKLTIDNYAVINNKSSFSLSTRSCDYTNKEDRIYSDEWCKKHFKDCLDNYDLNMNYFSLLNHDEFGNEIDRFINKNKKFVEVNNLNLYDGKLGYYHKGIT